MFPDTFCLDGNKTFWNRRKLRWLLSAGLTTVFVAASPLEWIPVGIRSLVEKTQIAFIENASKYVRLPHQHPLVTVVWTASGFWISYLVSRSYRRVANADFLDKIKLSLIQLAYKWIPSVRARLDKEFNSACTDIKKSLLTPIDGKVFASLPEKPLSYSEVDSLVSRRTAGEREEYSSGKVSGAVYFTDIEREKFLAKIHGDFGLSNLLHPELFPAVRQMEAEVVRMVATMLGGDENTAGCVTSGGTESLLMAVKAYRDCAKEQNGIFDCEIIVADSVHAALDKAESYFGIKLVRVPMNELGEISVPHVRRAVNSNTILIVGSAPGYPHGTMDNIPALSDIAVSHNIGLHVDCCLGSFIVPHQEEAGFKLPYKFDFKSVPGVTSISCDTHKFGFAPKGTSVIIYRDSTLRSYQFFTCPRWMGGIYASPSVAGSRAGGAVAAAWAALLTKGKEGYVDAAKKTLTCARRILNGIENPKTEHSYIKKEIRILGRPDSTVVAFRAETLPIHAISEAMREIGHWHLNNLQKPNGVHICCTLAIAGEHPEEKADIFLNDLNSAVIEVEKRKAELNKKGGAAMYGMAATVPSGLVAALTKVYFDVMLMLSSSKA